MKCYLNHWVSSNVIIIAFLAISSSSEFPAVIIDTNNVIIFSGILPLSFLLWHRCSSIRQRTWRLVVGPSECAFHLSANTLIVVHCVKVPPELRTIFFNHTVYYWVDRNCTSRQKDSRVMPRCNAFLRFHGSDLPIFTLLGFLKHCNNSVQMPLQILQWYVEYFRGNQIHDVWMSVRHGWNSKICPVDSTVFTNHAVTTCHW